MSREGLADLIASLTQPNVAARYRVRGVAVEPSPVSTAHRDRWRARVKRTKDTGRLRFTERGVHLANNLAVPWNARGAANPMLWLVLDVVARYPDPQAALEMLGEHRLWPWAPGDTDAPRWWCERCEGRGYGLLTRRDSEPVRATCSGRCDNGTLDTPPSLAALVAVASLGAATLRGVAELVRELRAVAKGETGATLVWRVMTREALREHHVARASAWSSGDVAMDAAMLFSMETTRQGDRWPEVLHPRALPPAPRRWWPILRALAVHEDETPTGLHLVAADRTRVVIAVEALG